MDRPIVINEKRGITITIGVLVHFLVTATIVMMAYATVRSDLSNVIIQSQRNEAQIKATIEVLDKARLDLTSLDSKFDQFMKSYDRDMNRYVREEKDRR